jgi:imidazolonepropionase-like amidohydrolase
VAVLLAFLVWQTPGAGRTAAAEAQSSPDRMPVYEFTNGRWFNGHDFQRKTFYSVDGRLTLAKPAKVDTILDLAGGYVVPPFGDAHNHNFSSIRTIAADVQMYLGDGIFYSMVQTDIRTGAQAVAEQVNRPDSVDVIFAHGALTGIHSHPATSYEARALGFYGHDQEVAHAAEIRASHQLENDAYYTIDSASELEEKWPAILTGKPDFIKVMLLHSEDYEARRKRTGEGEGFDPKLMPALAAKAHAAGLRLSVHVDSAYDLHVAVAAGVDMLAHLPGYYFRPEDEGRLEEVYALSADDVREIARRHIVISPTANWADWETNPKVKARIRAMQIRNLRLLKQAGVTLGVGTDSFGMDSLKEAFYLQTLCLFSNLELLKMWTEDTARIIYPGRKIGHLEEGYEASFLVLKSNPLEHFEATLDIAMRFKQGRELTEAK